MINVYVDQYIRTKESDFWLLFSKLKNRNKVREYFTLWGESDLPYMELISGVYDEDY